MSTKIESPWDGRAIELADKQGPYADFCAWEEWMGGEMDLPCIGFEEKCNCAHCQVGLWWDDCSAVVRAFLYDAMNKAIEWPEVTT